MKKISIVVPCYNEEETVGIFLQEIQKVRTASLTEYDLEIIFVDDGSTDHTLLEIKRMAESDTSVKYIALSRNFGKESALYAGLTHADGDYVAVMDVDLQDPPGLLAEMVKRLEAGGCQCAAARRISRRGESVIRSFFSGCFYRLFRR